MSILFWLSQAISVVLTAAAGAALYIVGFTLAIMYRFVRYVWREVL